MRRHTYAAFLRGPKQNTQIPGSQKNASIQCKGPINHYVVQV